MRSGDRSTTTTGQLMLRSIHGTGSMSTYVGLSSQAVTPAAAARNKTTTATQNGQRRGLSSTDLKAAPCSDCNSAAAATMVAMAAFRAIGCCLAGGLAIMVLASCDYPEQGCFELVALDAYSAPVASWPLLVEELTDDTHMTYGFTVLIPVDGDLLELPLQNSEDMTRRAWTLTLSHADLQLGDLDLELSHSEDRLSFTGAYRVPPPVELPERPAMATTDPPAPPVDTRPGYGFGGYVLPADTGGARLIINGQLPPLPDALTGVAGFELRSLTREQFEAVLGCAVDDALRVLSSPREPLEVSSEPPPAPAEQLVATDTPPEEEAQGDGEGGEDDADQGEAEQPPRGPPLGGRGGQRPR